jgi:hypothetical protein
VTDERNAPGKERYLPDTDPEKTMLGAVVPCDLGWSDLGSWESLQSVTGETQEALLRRHQG